LDLTGFYRARALETLVRDAPNFSWLANVVSPKVLNEREYEEIHDLQELLKHGFSQEEVDGLTAPVLLVNTYGLDKYAPAPKVAISQPPADMSNHRQICHVPKSAGVFIDLHGSVENEIELARCPLFLTGNIVENDFVLSRGFCSATILGMEHLTGSETSAETPEGVRGVLATLKEELDSLSLANRDIYIAFGCNKGDSEIIRKVQRYIAKFLLSKGACVRLISLTETPAVEDESEYKTSFIGYNCLLDPVLVHVGAHGVGTIVSD
jgi:hypothetical protein